ncbi:unnamed protein product [Phytophthora lilii]|uniref:RxLR effector protein n=1 Tax=Phytophthora lilii TaxID=2077276 RepID=A0A9W6WWA2_9STRA|nr:unnamed protein product [Phytophthora lilii]
MRFSHFLLLVVAVFLACCDTTTAAKIIVTRSNGALAFAAATRYLKGSTEITDQNVEGEERAGAQSFKQYLGMLKLPKFSNLPLIKQLNQIRLKFEEKAGKAYLAQAKKRYEADHQNFM